VPAIEAAHQSLDRVQIMIAREVPATGSHLKGTGLGLFRARMSAVVSAGRSLIDVR